MELKNIKTLILGLVNSLKQTVLTITGKVEVDFPEVQKAEVINFPQPLEAFSVTNLSEITTVLDKDLQSLRNAIIALPKPESIQPVLEVLERLIDAVNEKEIPITDISGILKKLDEPLEVTASLKIE